VKAPSAADLLVEKGDEPSLREALELEPGHETAIVALGQLLIDTDRPDEALVLLARIPENADTRLLSARARLAESQEVKDLSDTSEVDSRLTELLEIVKDDEVARQEFLDLLEAIDDEDNRKATFRKALTSRLF